MTNDLFDLADKLWRGETSIEDHHPITNTGDLSEVRDGVAFIPSFANVTVFSTGEGIVLVDTGSPMFARQIHSQIRAWSDRPLHTAIYTHGHIDHVFGVASFDEEAEANGWPRPRVLAHAGVVRRFDRYRLTAGYNAVINQRQFQAAGLRWPTGYRYPDETFHRSKTLEVGGRRFELTHGKGETDDHLWVWEPEAGILCCGDFFIWASPNAGNPQKVQRYPKDWALACRQMASLGADLMLPGHGFPIVGRERIVEALENTAALLDSLHDQTLELMNDGVALNEVLHSVKPPADLLAKPYLRPIYDEPEFVVRNVWRLYGGWFDGDPASLKPAPSAALAKELAKLAGGAARLAERAIELADQDELRVAAHLADLVRPAGVVEHPLRGGGLAGIDVRHDADVPGLFQRVLRFHGTSFLSLLDGAT
jgi:alkyl sulfatase BDS1-like metallo-beta-lactamase superfamily hydrolase